MHMHKAENFRVEKFCPLCEYFSGNSWKQKRFPRIGPSSGAFIISKLPDVELAKVQSKMSAACMVGGHFRFYKASKQLVAI